MTNPSVAANPSATATRDRALDPESFGLFLAVHVAALVGIVFTGISWFAVTLMVLSYIVRMWAITAGYHRYFSHRGFKTSRVFGFILGAIGTIGLQKGPLWWAAHHRRHHRRADTEDDLHSVHQEGFVWAYVGWAFASRNQADDYAAVRDFARYPELRFLNHYHYVVPAIVAALVWIVFGTVAFVWVCVVPTVLQWHAIFAGNIYCHSYGKRWFDTPDFSTNSLLFAFILLGEGWHNNHHYFPSSARQGFRWWEFDPTYYSLRLLQMLGIVWDLREVPDHLMAKALAPTLRHIGSRLR